MSLIDTEEKTLTNGNESNLKKTYTKPELVAYEDLRAVTGGQPLAS